MTCIEVCTWRFRGNWELPSLNSCPRFLKATSTAVALKKALCCPQPAMLELGTKWLVDRSYQTLFQQFLHFVQFFFDWPEPHPGAQLVFQLMETDPLSVSSPGRHCCAFSQEADCGGKCFFWFIPGPSKCVVKVYRAMTGTFVSTPPEFCTRPRDEKVQRPEKGCWSAVSE